MSQPAGSRRWAVFTMPVGTMMMPMPVGNMVMTTPVGAATSLPAQPGTPVI